MRKSVADGTAEPEPQTPQQKRAALLAKKTNDLKAAAAKRQEEYKAKMQALKDRGGTVMETMKLTKEFAASEMAAQKQLAGGGDSFEKSAALNAAMMDEAMDGMDTPMVKLGDASIASPFTSKMPSIKASLDIVRQGRCTLLTTLQMYLILALNCLNSAFSLSVLYLDGIKYGDKQMTATGILMSISFITISQAKSLPQLAPVRPLTSIFHPAMFFSLVGQFAVHLVRTTRPLVSALYRHLLTGGFWQSTMVYAHSLAKPLMPADFKVDLRELDEAGNNTFTPSILNTVVFYISTVQQVCVFAVNYKGRPFMQGLTENPPLLYSLGLCGALAVATASELFPPFNAYLQLVPLPDAEFRNTILALLAVNIVVTVVWDRLMSFIFARHIFRASVEDWSMEDVAKLFKLVAIVCGVIWWLGNNVETLEEIEKEMEAMDLEDEEAEVTAQLRAAEELGGPGGWLASWFLDGTEEAQAGDDGGAAAHGAKCGPGTVWDAEAELCVVAQ